MSVTWYTGSSRSVRSVCQAGTLDNLARVLRLDPIERKQLFQLALRQPAVDSTSQRETVSPRFQRMLDYNATMPAFVMGRRWDILAWNQAARAFFSISSKCPRTNAIWFGFFSPAQLCAP